MKKLVYILCALMVPLAVAAADEENEQSQAANAATNDSWKYRLRVNKFERQFSTRNDDQHAEWAAFIMAGTHINRLWLAAKGTTTRGETDSAEVRLFYSRTVAPYLGMKIGWKRDIKPDPERDWLELGVIGVVPYKIGTDASLFVGESGRLSARLEIAYKHWFTQKLSLTPDLEANFYSEDDPETGVGSGLSNLDLGLRLRYRVMTGLSPYAGITWKGNFGNTADMIEKKGEDTSDLRFLLGVTMWF